MGSRYQQLIALEQANAVRRARRQYADTLRTPATRAEALVRAAEYVANPPQELAGARVDWLLTKTKYLGPRSAARLFEHAGVPAHLSLGQLTERQRTKLVACMRYGPERV